MRNKFVRRLTAFFVVLCMVVTMLPAAGAVDVSSAAKHMLNAAAAESNLTLTGTMTVIKASQAGADVTASLSDPTDASYNSNKTVTVLALAVDEDGNPLMGHSVRQILGEVKSSGIEVTCQENNVQYFAVQATQSVIDPSHIVNFTITSSPYNLGENSYDGTYTAKVSISDDLTAILWATKSQADILRNLRFTVYLEDALLDDSALAGKYLNNFDLTIETVSGISDPIFEQDGSATTTKYGIAVKYKLTEETITRWGQYDNLKAFKDDVQREMTMTGIGELDDAATLYAALNADSELWSYGRIEITYEPNGVLANLPGVGAKKLVTPAKLAHLQLTGDFVKIRPVDLTIYVGGNAGYEQVVDANGNVVSEGESTSMPQPIFYVETLNGVSADGWTITATAAGSEHRGWTIRAIAGAPGYYTIDPDQGQDPVRMQYTDPNGKVQISDAFDISSVKDLYAEFTAEIFTNKVNVNTLRVKDTSDKEYFLGMTAGKLYVRTVEEDNPVVEAVSYEPSEAVESNEAHIQVDAGTKFTVNNTGIPVPDNVTPSLLFDTIVTSDGTDRVSALEDQAETVLEPVESGLTRNYETRYLDLVDAENGNLWIKADRPVTVYWGYPSGTDKNTDFTVLHFDGLHRDSSSGGASGYDLSDITNCKVDNLTKGTADYTVEKTDEGIKITIPSGGFSPFMLVWDESSGGSSTTRYTLTYVSNGGTEYDPERYDRNTVVDLDKVPFREGYTFEGWYLDSELTERVETVTMTRNITVYAKWKPTDIPDALNGENHFAYIIGRTGGMIEPESDITRAEVATIFFRLLKDDVREANLSTENIFTDVQKGEWYNVSVSTMAKMGIVEGDPEGTFRPNESITRAEFAAIASRFEVLSYDGSDLFSDISGHWAAEYINSAVVRGWITGYADGTFRPDQNISRAEAMTLVNRVLKRLPENTDDLLDGMIMWPDNQDETAWYYLTVQEATNSHDFERKSDNVHESWTQLTENVDWTDYQY